MPAADRLLLATLTGSNLTVVRDVQDLAHARTICTLSRQGPASFVDGHTIAYVRNGAVVRADLTAGTAVELAGSAVSTFAFSLGGAFLSFTQQTGPDGVAWHLVTAAGDRILAKLPPAGRDETLTLQATSAARARVLADAGLAASPLR